MKNATGTEVRGWESDVEEALESAGDHSRIVSETIAHYQKRMRKVFIGGIVVGAVASSIVTFITIHILLIQPLLDSFN